MQAYKIDVRKLTEQQKKDVQEAFLEMGYGWRIDGEVIQLLDKDYYYAENDGVMTYGITWEAYCNNNNYTKITYKELMTLANKGEDNMPNNFTKADLKDGMVVVYRDGNERLVYNNKLLTLDGFGGSNLTLFFREDLTSSSGNSMDIMEVMYMGESIWKRSEQTQQQQQLSELKAAQEQLMLQAKDIADKIDALQQG